MFEWKMRKCLNHIKTININWLYDNVAMLCNFLVNVLMRGFVTTFHEFPNFTNFIYETRSGNSIEASWLNATNIERRGGSKGQEINSLTIRPNV